MNPQTTATYKAIGKLDDRSGLSQEMRDLCANLPIYRVVKQNNNADQMSDSGETDPAEVPAGEGKNRIDMALIRTRRVSMPTKSGARWKVIFLVSPSINFLRKKCLFSSEQSSILYLYRDLSQRNPIIYYFVLFSFRLQAAKRTLPPSLSSLLLV